jgi:hypothetical protein
VGVVKEPIDGCRREALREDRVEAGWVQVRGQDQRALLVGGVDQPIQRLASSVARRIFVRIRSAPEAVSFPSFDASAESARTAIGTSRCKLLSA